MYALRFGVKQSSSEGTCPAMSTRSARRPSASATRPRGAGQLRIGMSGPNRPGSRRKSWKTVRLLQRGITTWYLCQHGITEVPDSTHTMLTQPPCGKCAVDIIKEAYKELECLQMVGPTSYYDGLSNGLMGCGWICELILRRLRITVAGGDRSAKENLRPVPRLIRTRPVVHAGGWRVACRGL